MPDEENPKGFTGKAKCGGRKRTKGASPTALSGARAREAGEAYSGCYVQLPPTHVLEYLRDKLNSARNVMQENEEGEKYFFTGAVVGNKRYAWRRENSITAVIDRIGFKKKNTVWITLTEWCDGSEKAREKSWKNGIKKIPKTLRILKKFGMTDYILVFEANTRGGCHLHILSKWGIKLKFVKMGEVIRVVNPNLRGLLKKIWGANIDVRGMRDDNITGYLKKYLGKYGHIEDALRRAERNWENEGDSDHVETDVKKLWTFYYCGKLKKRQYTTSRASPEEREEMRRKKKADAAQAAALIKEMNNPTERKEQKWVKTVVIPNWLKKHKDYRAYSGKLEKGSKCELLMRRFLAGEYIDVEKENAEP